MRKLLSLTTIKSDRRGVSALEYGLMASFIALAIVGGVTAFGSALDGFFSKLATTVDGFSKTS